MLWIESNKSDSDINLKIILISYFMYKLLKNKIKWYFLQYLYFLRKFYPCIFQQIKQFATYPVQSDYTPYSSHLKFLMQSKKLLSSCKLLLDVMKEWWPIEHFVSLNHWDMASHIRLWTVEGVKLQQQRQDKHASVIASKLSLMVQNTSY